MFKNKIDELRIDIGRDIEIWTKTDPEDCLWCIQDEMSGKSTGIPESGKTWSTHPNYYGSDVRCPNCDNEGVINLPIINTIENVIIDDSDGGLVYIHGKLGIIPDGSKSLIGKLEDVLLDPDDENSRTLFADAIKIIVDGEDYRATVVKRFGLKGNYLFQASIEHTDAVDEREAALIT